MDYLIILRLRNPERGQGKCKHRSFTFSQRSHSQEAKAEAEVLISSILPQQCKSQCLCQVAELCSEVQIEICGLFLVSSPGFLLILTVRLYCLRNRTLSDTQLQNYIEQNENIIGSGSQYATVSLLITFYIKFLILVPTLNSYHLSEYKKI